MAAPAPPQQPAQAPAVVVDTFQIASRRSFAMPRLKLLDRRGGGAPRMLYWVFQKHLELVLYGREVDAGSSGAIWKLLSATGLGQSAMQVNARIVNDDDGDVTTREFDALLSTYRTSSPAIDPSSLGRVRQFTLLPVATAAAIARTFGRSIAAQEFLGAFGQAVPQSWQLEAEQEALAAQHEVDLLLEEQLAAQQSFEAEDVSFEAELQSMAAFSKLPEDEGRVSQYALSRPSQRLRRELDEYIADRMATFNAVRAGGAVVSGTAENDVQAVLRFFGWLRLTDRLPEESVAGLALVFVRADLGDLVEAYCTWLAEQQGLRFSSIANYVNSLLSIASHCDATYEVPEETLALEPSPLTQLINLRAQAEKASKTQQLFEKRVGGWIEWPEVQAARIKAVQLLKEATDKLKEQGTPLTRAVVRDAAALSLLSLIPPDRVGVIRKLRFAHTLKRADGGGWRIDLSKLRDGHKTTRFYGPFAAKLPSALDPVLDAYAQALELEFSGDEAYLFGPIQSGALDRPMEGSAWTAYVKRLFKRLHGSEVTPKTLRSSFITWLRESTDCPQVLKAAAHAMKHKPETQASGRYDQNADTKLVKAAYDFNLSFASAFTREAAVAAAAAAAPASATAAAAGSSSDAVVVAAAPTAAVTQAARGKARATSVLPTAAPPPAPPPPTAAAAAAFASLSGGLADDLFDEMLRSEAPAAAPAAPLPLPPQAEDVAMSDGVSMASVPWDHAGNAYAAQWVVVDEPLPAGCPAVLGKAFAFEQCDDKGYMIARWFNAEYGWSLAKPIATDEKVPEKGAIWVEYADEPDVHYFFRLCADAYGAQSGKNWCLVRRKQEPPATTAAAASTESEATPPPPPAQDPVERVPPPAPLRSQRLAAVGSASTRPAWASPHPKRLKPLPPTAPANAPAAVVEEEEEEEWAAAPASTAAAAGNSAATADNDKDFSHGGFSVGEEVLALGHGPAGHALFRARVVKLNAPPVWPPLRVKFLATVEGATMALSLPSPRVANVSAADLKPLPLAPAAGEQEQEAAA